MPVERALLVTAQLDPRFDPAPSSTSSLGGSDRANWPIEDEAAELEELATSAGCRIVGQVTARRHRPVAGTFLGEGKLDQIAQLVDELQAQVVVINQELSSAQQRTIGPACDSVESPLTFTEAAQQPGFNEQLQMTGDARLTLTQYLCQLGDRELGTGAKRQKTEPCRLARCSESC